MFETREVIVRGTPRSLQAAARGLKAWRDRVVEAAERDVGDEMAPIQYVDVGVRILHFCAEWGDTDGDLDNIAKPILDALCDSRRVLFNDNQVKELLLRRIEWSKHVSSIENATMRLAQAVDEAVRGGGSAEFVYIWVTTELTLGRLP